MNSLRSYRRRGAIALLVGIVYIGAAAVLGERVYFEAVHRQDAALEVSWVLVSFYAAGAFSFLCLGMALLYASLLARSD